MKIYRSPEEAYPFLSDEPEDLRCDYEILTDEIASLIGLLQTKVDNEKLRENLLFICEMVYHLNPALRTDLKILQKEEQKLNDFYLKLKEKHKNDDLKFVLPQGSENACLSHIIRTNLKQAVRLVYRYIYQDNKVDYRIIDILNLLSNIFFYLSLELNTLEGIDEIEFKSRNY